MNGNLGIDRKHSITSQPPMHLNYPPKPQQLLHSIQTSTPHLSNSGIGRAPMQPPDMSFVNSSPNRANSVGYSNNPGGTATSFISNRGPGQTPPGGFQQGVFGTNGSIAQPQHSMHSHMRSSHGQFQGPPERPSFPQHVSNITRFY